MNLLDTLGPSSGTRLLCLFALIFALGDIFASLFTIFYQRFYFPKILRPRYKTGFAPRCSIIVPCKGTPKNFRNNLSGFLELDYADFEVIFVTESESDSANPVIRSLIEKAPNARHVIAGIATKCAQKNYNLIAAIDAVKTPELLIFADSDIKPGRLWLTELIAPLSNPKVTVTSGYRWLHATKGSIGEQSHAYANVFIYTCFCTASFFGGVGLWGGSIAIRKKDFDDLGVKETWGRTAVDDMSLSAIVVKSRRKGVVVPTGMTHSDDLLPTMHSTAAWFERQIMFLKCYFKPVWFFLALPVTAIALFLMLLLPVALFTAIFTDISFAEAGGFAALIFYIGEYLAVSLYPAIGPMPKFAAFLLYMPIIRISQAWSYFRTHFTNVITWAGIRYHIKFSGDVSRVDRGGR